MDTIYSGGKFSSLVKMMRNTRGYRRHDGKTIYKDIKSFTTLIYLEKMSVSVVFYFILFKGFMSSFLDKIDALSDICSSGILSF